MQRKAIGSVIAFLLLGALAVGQAQQAQESYLDVFTVQVKPDKRAEFDAIGRKIAMANRQNKGDTWIAMETVYGPGDRVSFVSAQQLRRSRVGHGSVHGGHAEDLRKGCH